MKKFSTVLLFASMLAIVVSSLFGLSLFITVPAFTAAATFIPTPAGVLGLNSTNNQGARASFDHARTMFAKAMLDKFVEKYGVGSAWSKAIAWANSLKLSQNEIRREVQLTTASQNFRFGVTTVQLSQGAAGLFNTEVPLNQQDSLCVTEYGMFVRDPASATSTIDPLCTYGDPIQFATANVATALNTFYDHGQFKITVNNDVVLPARGLFNHKYIPQTQNGIGITAQTLFPLNQIRGAEDGFITCEPNIVLIGSKNYVPEIVLPASLAAVETFQRAVLIFRGILAQNSTVIN
jgi:hypothetical protein